MAHTLADDPELLRHFTREELLQHEAEQRKDCKRLAARREREVGDDATTASSVDFSIAASILAPFGITPRDEKEASKLARIFVALQQVQRKRGTVRGSDFEESDKSIFTEAAKLAGAPASEVLALSERVRRRMRDLT